MKTKEILLTVLAAVLLTGCSAEIEQGQTVGGMPINLGYSVVTATAETRAATNLNNDALTLGSVAVSVKKHTDGTYTTTYNYTAAAGGALSPATASNQFYYETDGSSSDIIAYYPATASTTFPVQADQTSDDNYKASDLMWAQVTDQMPTNSTVNLEFSHKMSKIIVNASAGTGVTSITSITLNNVKRKVSFDPTTGTTTLAATDNNPTTVTMSNNGAAIIPPQTIDGNFITITTNAGTAVYAVENKAFESGHQYTLNITVNAAAIGATNTITGWDDQGTVNVQPTVTEKQYVFFPEGAIPGLFSVSATKKVFFSKGNLQYTKSTGKWSFMEHQYSTVETINQNVGTNYASQNIVSLFGWGTSDKAISNYGSAYQPYATSTTASAYGPNGSYNLTGTYADGDWGVNIGTGWYTLTGGIGGEWAYLFNIRSTSTVNGTANARYAKAKVCNVQGVILFPDTYSHPSGVTPPAGINATDDTGWNGNNYDATAWSAMETAGCVFLPAAGYRYGASVYIVGSNGYYWSSTASSNTDTAYTLSFTSGSVSPATNVVNNRYNGQSVRLVRVAP